jgi:hypothetical protein
MLGERKLHKTWKPTFLGFKAKARFRDDLWEVAPMQDFEPSTNPSCN